MMIQNERYALEKINDDNFAQLTENRFIVGIDFDGVITMPHLLKIYYLCRLGYTVKAEDIERNNCINKLRISEEDYNDASLKAYLEKPEILPLENQLKESFLDIKKLENISLVIVTSRYDSMLDHLQNYLKHHQLRFDGVAYTENKSKTSVLKKINAHLFVDDSLHKLEAIIDEYPDIVNSCTLALFRNIQNKNQVITDKRIREVVGWPSLKDMIKEKFEEKKT